MHKRLTGIKATGHLHLGNYLGAIAPMVASQHATDSVVFVADLHALTVDHDPARVRALTREAVTLLLAAGVDPNLSTIYVQSHLAEHAELHYLLECATSYGEAHRMIQFKEKAGTQQQVRLSLLTYPVLMAADILLHDADEVPVGDDQTQHVELTRDVAVRFNSRYGETFVVPKAVNPSFVARVMDLSDPGTKMGKTNSTDAGVLSLLDTPEVIRRKVMRAVTDGGRPGPGETLRYDPVAQPGVANLLNILSGCLSAAEGTSDVGHPPTSLAGQFDSYGQLKAAVVDAVLAVTQPIHQRYAQLRRERSAVDEVLREGAQRARRRASATVRRARRAIGLLD